MNFNIGKCKVMVLNGSPFNIEFTLSGEVLKMADSHRYLGIILTSKYVTNLFRTHFSTIIGKAKMKAAVIRRHGFH